MVVRGNRVPVEEPPPAEPKPRRSIAAGLALVLLVLLLIGVAVVELATGLVRVAAARRGPWDVIPSEVRHRAALHDPSLRSGMLRMTRRP